MKVVALRIHDKDYSDWKKQQIFYISKSLKEAESWLDDIPAQVVFL